MPAMTSGRVRQSISLQPSRAGPPKSSAAEVEVLDVGAERAVEHDDPFGDGVEVRALAMGSSRLSVASPGLPGVVRIRRPLGQTDGR